MAEADKLFLRLSHFATLDLIRVPHERLYHITIAERNQGLAHRTTVTLTEDEAMAVARFLANVYTNVPLPPKDLSGVIPAASDPEISVAHIRDTDPNKKP